MLIYVQKCYIWNIEYLLDSSSLQQMGAFSHWPRPGCLLPAPAPLARRPPSPAARFPGPLPSPPPLARYQADKRMMMVMKLSNTPEFLPV